MLLKLSCHRYLDLDYIAYFDCEWPLDEDPDVEAGEKHRYAYIILKTGQKIRIHSDEAYVLSNILDRRRDIEGKSQDLFWGMKEEYEKENRVSLADLPAADLKEMAKISKKLTTTKKVKK